MAFTRAERQQARSPAPCMRLFFGGFKFPPVVRFPARCAVSTAHQPTNHRQLKTGEGLPLELKI